MSGDRNPEVVGCDASIMRNVWEIRAREYGQKIQLEQERIEKSALPSINQDWANRLSAKLGTHNRLRRKTKPNETKMDNNNIWKSTQTQIPSALSHGAGSAALGRPGSQSRGFSSPVPNFKNKKGQDKKFNRLQLLMFITQAQPSAMVWGKSWKYNKSLPSSERTIARTNWGQCWMFATQQPNSEAGKPWPNGPNMMDPHNLHLWKKPDYRMVESQELDLCFPTEEWHMSWRKPDKKNKKQDTTSVNGENAPKFGCFNLLVETQCHNEALCSSEWSKSWRSTKPSDQQDNFTVPNDVLMYESIANKQVNDREISPKWEESWKFVNHHDCNKSKSLQIQKSHGSEWANAWRAAMVVSNSHKHYDLSLRQDHSDTYDDWGQQKESHVHKVMLLSHEQKYRDLYFHLCKEFKSLAEWNKSWQVTKNNSKPCEEIEKVLKVSKMENRKVEENPKEQYLTSEKVDPCYQQLKNTVIYYPKREFTHKLLHQKHMENVLFASEWRESWKTHKHRMRIERRRMRPDPSRPFRESENGGDIKPRTSEWKDSWKLTCQPLCQKHELWQQVWSTTPQIRVDRMRDRDHFAPVQLFKNGTTVEQSWGESWKFSGNQKQSEPRQGNAQTVACHHPEASLAHQGYVMSVSDWQAAWMISETQFHHDKPSLTQWMEAWRSVFHTEQIFRENYMDGFMKIQSQREKISLQRAKAKMIRSFDNLIFRKIYHEKEWSASWKAGSLLNYQLSHYGPSGSSTTPQQHATANVHGSKWGMSFRLANPMPRVEQPWVECSSNPCHYAVMWSRRKDILSNINTNFSNNRATLKLWVNSHQFLHRGNTQIKEKSKSKTPGDPRVIITKNTKTRRHLYSNIEKEKQSERKWAGCHLLGKTQPRPKRGPSVKKIKIEDENKDWFFEDWRESWRFLAQPNCLKKQMTIKSLSGWDESWKFLLPPYQTLSGPKAR
ncbi:hypothetical protein PAMA_008128 [Pampus argenteus]